MLRTIIVDDEADSREILRNFLADYCPDVEVVGEADSVSSAKALIMDSKPDLALLDIEINEGTGIDVLFQTPSVLFKTIFITAFQEYAVQAFRFSAIDYLLKPVNFNELLDAINKAKLQIDLERLDVQRKTLEHNLDKNKKKILVLSTQEYMTAVNVEQIIRCESSAGYTTFFLEDGRSMLISKGLKDYEELLVNHGFIRAHQSHLINLKYFQAYLKKDEMIELINGDLVPLASRKKDVFLQRINSL